MYAPTIQILLFCMGSVVSISARRRLSLDCVFIGNLQPSYKRYKRKRAIPAKRADSPPSKQHRTQDMASGEIVTKPRKFPCKVELFLVS